MKTPKKLETYFNLIENIKYENEHGGAYAYIQFLAYSREVLKLLRSVKNVEKYTEALEGTNWLFNEYLGVKFTFRQKVIFDNKLIETKEIFNSIRASFNTNRTNYYFTGRSVHAQAA